MLKRIIFFITVTFSLFFLLNSVHSQDRDPMYNFYGGLADIIENNMDNPDGCVAQADRFIRNNIEPLKKAAERGRRMVEDRRHEEITEAEAQKMMQQGANILAKSKGFQAMNRFMELLNSFAMQHPEHAEKILDVMSEYNSEFEGR